MQIFDGEKLQTLALDQWTRDVAITGERGDIMDRNGLNLVDTETLYTVYVRPVAVKNKQYTADTLARVLGIDGQALFAKMTSKVSEITVSKKVSKSKMLELTLQDVSGVYYSQNINRIYPYGDFMTQILGFTNVDGVGQSGVEAYYNKYLTGTDGSILTETDLVGRELESNVTKYFADNKGNSVYLTLDANIQSIVESSVSNAYLKFNASNVSCMVMNCKTGEMLAMSQRPSYDLNNIPRDDVLALFAQSKCQTVSSVYEPGSTFKILTTALALETNSISASYHLYCPGYRIVDGQRIKCWRTIGHGSETFIEGVQNSCNCLFMDIAAKVGIEKFYDWIEQFGMTKVTGIDMSGEASGLSIAESTVKNVDLARMSFGQAIAVTPIELLTACASVVNGGNLMTPYIVDKIVDNKGKTVVQNYPIVKSKTISESTSYLMREILESVVTDGGGKNAQVSGYRIGGKTGTAQKYVNGKIAQGKYVSTFLGFAPADDPEYIMLFIVDEPQGYLYYGSMVAAPYASQVFSQIFSYKGIAPTRLKEELPTFEMPYLTGLTIEESVNILKKLNIYYEITGEGGKVNYQFPVGGAMITKNNVVYIEVK